MADQRTMAQLLKAPTEAYEDAIVVPGITADNFELKHGLLTLVQNKLVKEKQEKDKIGTKQTKREAWKIPAVSKANHSQKSKKREENTSSKGQICKS
nr:reverse transcriptase domain-containing protein [Tanacetum cinerariifolium]